MASKYNNLTRLYRVNIQRKNRVGHKSALQIRGPSWELGVAPSQADCPSTLLDENDWTGIAKSKVDEQGQEDNPHRLLNDSSACAAAADSFQGNN